MVMRSSAIFAVHISVPGLDYFLMLWSFTPKRRAQKVSQTFQGSPGFSVRKLLQIDMFGKRSIIWKPKGSTQTNIYCITAITNDSDSCLVQNMNLGNCLAKERKGASPEIKCKLKARF